MSERGSEGSSFRDPAGSVFYRDDVLYRQVNQVYKADYEHLMSSGLYEALTSTGLLIPHVEVDPSLGTTDETFRVLRPEPVGFISYPYEWCFGQLKDAALTTLEIQSLALDHGMSLRDASAYNIQFHRGRPLLIDTLSFERRTEDVPWVAYKQFCQHFLAPLAIMSLSDVRLGQLLKVYLDGVPLDLASGLLPARSRLHASLTMHLHMHAKSQRRGGKGTERRGSKGSERTVGAVSERALRGLIDSLQSAVRKLEWEPEATQWATYYPDAPSYSEAAAEHKREIVRGYLDRISPRTVWDLGANTGLYSRLAAEAGAATTVSFDGDPSAVELSYKQLRAEGEMRVLPLVQDLTNPSPGIGWNNDERRSLGDRGPADALLALALVHHLAIGNNVPLDLLARTLASWGEWLIIEFVPRSDPQVEGMLAHREDIFTTYDEDGFRAAFEGPFTLEATDAIKDSERTLYLMRRRPGTDSQEKTLETGEAIT